MFATFLPFLFWHVDQHLGIRSVVVWAFIWGFGQYVKEVFRLPRPNIETRLEFHYDTEYGFPSTHAGGSLALAVTFFGYFLTRYDLSSSVVPWWLEYVMYLGMVSWVVMCCLSRLYLGVHSPVDIYGGLLISAIQLLLYYVYLIDYVEPILLSDSMAVPVCIMVGTAIVLALYSTSMWDDLRKRSECKDVCHLEPAWRSSYGDTARILGVFAGVLCGMWLFIHQFQPLDLIEKLQNTTVQKPSIQSLFMSRDYLYMILSSVVGVVVMMINKEITRRILFYLARKFYLSEKEQSLTMKQVMTQRYDVEIPIITLTYAAIGFTAVYIVPVYVMKQN